MSTCDPPESPWEAADQALWYRELCADSPHYLAPSRALIQVAGQLATAWRSGRVADLGCGTGETSRAILEALGSRASLLAVDPASRVLAMAAAAVGDDPRVELLHGHAPDLRVRGPFDAVFCAAAVWLVEDLTHTASAIAACLAPEGLFAASLPAELLGDVGHLTTPPAIAVAAALADLQSVERTTVREAPVIAPALGSDDSLDGALRAGGLGVQCWRTWSRIGTVAERIRWLAQPVVLAGMGLAVAPERFTEHMTSRLTAAGLDETAPIEARWRFVVARAAR